MYILYIFHKSFFKLKVKTRNLQVKKSKILYACTFSTHKKLYNINYPYLWYRWQRKQKSHVMYRSIYGTYTRTWNSEDKPCWTGFLNIQRPPSIDMRKNQLESPQETGGIKTRVVHHFLANATWGQWWGSYRAFVGRVEHTQQNGCLLKQAYKILFRAEHWLVFWINRDYTTFTREKRDSWPKLI